MEKNFNVNKYQRARDRVDELKKFYNNLTIYLIFVVFLAGINYYTTGFGYMWFLWAAFGWGIGVFFHALKTFRVNPFFNKDWEERKIREFMEKDRETDKWK